MVQALIQDKYSKNKLNPTVNFNITTEDCKFHVIEPWETRCFGFQTKASTHKKNPGQWYAYKYLTAI